MPGMTPSFSRALDRLPTEQATDVDNAVEIVAKKFAPHRLHANPAQFQLTTRSGGVDDVHMHHVAYGTPIQIDAAPLQSNYLLCVPAHGTASVTIAGKEWQADTQHAMLLPPGEEFRLHWHDASPQVVLSIPHTRMQRIATALAGDDDPRALPTSFSLTTAAGRALATEMRVAHEDINSGSAAEFPAFMQRNVADGLVARVLLAARESAAPDDALDPPPARTKLVAAFLELASSEQATEWSPMDVALRLRVPLRTLQESVQRELHSTPAEVLRIARLECARRHLRMADPAQSSVTEIAMACGFRHLGRFSVQYREAFGEKPSETLRRVQ